MPAFLKKRDNILVLAFGLVLVFFIGLDAADAADPGR